GSVRYRGERYVVERNGTPMAALIPLSDLDSPIKEQGPTGFLALTGAFNDAPEYPEILDEIVRSRHTQRSRPAPKLT
ncbi:MAG: hypothetical protein ACREN8_12060, partial [Candidatus Dormibacteraceae bacterium]